MNFEPWLLEILCLWNNMLLLLIMHGPGGLARRGNKTNAITKVAKCTTKARKTVNNIITPDKMHFLHCTVTTNHHHHYATCNSGLGGRAIVCPKHQIECKFFHWIFDPLEKWREVCVQDHANFELQLYILQFHVLELPEQPFQSPPIENIHSTSHAMLSSHYSQCRDNRVADFSRTRIWICTLPKCKIRIDNCFILTCDLKKSHLISFKIQILVWHPNPIDIQQLKVPMLIFDGFASIWWSVVFWNFHVANNKNTNFMC